MFNSMVFFVYYDKKDKGKSVLQLPFHRDQRWSSSGKFQSTLNSQKKDTPTVVLTLGDARKLYVQCFRDSNDCRSARVSGKWSDEEFVQTHGSLFELDPGDEETKLRKLFNSFNASYFKHGGVQFGNGLSIELPFCTATNTRPVDSATGKMVVEQEFSPEANINDVVLCSYLADDVRRKRNEDKLKRLHVIMRKYYFVFTYI